ncbi:MAG: host attachment protein [Alphaproteobacteria bacterium]
MTARTWILVADGCRGRVFQSEGPGTGIRPALNHDIYGCDDDQDFPGMNGNGRGRAFDRESFAQRLLGFGTGDKTNVSPSFTRAMARFLDRSMQDEAFDRLVIVAPPQVLGALRGALSSTVRARVASEVSKNLMNCATYELPKHLGPTMAA